MIYGFNIRSIPFVGSLGQGPLGPDNDSGGPVLDFVLDQVGDVALRAYSTRRLRRLYSGPLMRVRKEGTSYEADIYAADDGFIDAVAIEALCGTARGLVRIWYDQSGNGVNLSQNTSSIMPVVYDGSAVVETTANRKGVSLYQSADSATDKSLSTPVRSSLADFYNGGGMYAFIEQIDAGQGYLYAGSPYTSASYSLRIDDDAVSTSIRAQNYAGGTSQNMDDNASFTTEASITWNMDRAADDGELFKGNASIATIGSLTEQAGTNAVNGLVLGSGISGGFTVGQAFRGIICELIQFEDPITTATIDILDDATGNGFSCLLAGSLSFDFTTDTDWLEQEASGPITYYIAADGTTPDLYIKSSASPYTSLPAGYRCVYRILESTTIGGSYSAVTGWSGVNVVSGQVAINAATSTSVDKFYKVQAYFTKPGCADIGSEGTPYTSSIYRRGVTANCPISMIFAPSSGTDVGSVMVNTERDSDVDVNIVWTLEHYNGSTWDLVDSDTEATTGNIVVGGAGSGSYRITAYATKTGCVNVPADTKTYTVT